MLGPAAAAAAAATLGQARAAPSPSPADALPPTALAPSLPLASSQGVGVYDAAEGVIGKGEWSVKRGELSAGKLTEAQYKQMLDIWRTWPQYPKGAHLSCAAADRGARQGHHASQPRGKAVTAAVDQPLSSPLPPLAGYKGPAIHGHYLEVRRRRCCLLLLLQSCCCCCWRSRRYCGMLCACPRAPSPSHALSALPTHSTCATVLGWRCPGRGRRRHRLCPPRPRLHQ